MRTTGGQFQVEGVGDILPGVEVGTPPEPCGADFASLSSSYPGPVQLQQVVTRTDQRPLFADRPQPAPQELTEPARVLDLAERGFDDRLAPGVQAVTAQRRQRPRH